MTKSTIEKMRCIKCEKYRAMKNFYLSSSSSYPNGHYPVCKKCLLDDMDIHNEEQVKDVLLEMNKPYIYTLWLTSLEEGERVNRHPFGMYMKNINLNFKTYTWKDSEFNNTNLPSNNKQEPEEKETVENVEYEIIDNNFDDKDKKDVIRMLGYDPFIAESNEDKQRLYSKLVDFLDESTLEDGLKLQSVIEIVKGFNQIDKINLAITKITSDINSLATSSGGIKSLIESKKSILTSVLKLAEDNGISVKHNNQKSKGAGTLSGIIKQLQEKGFEEAQVNLFDIETCEGMRQVADISNESIMKQLQFDENDYTQMVLEQREMINELDAKVITLEEENRKLKKELLRLKGSDIDE